MTIPEIAALSRRVAEAIVDDGYEQRAILYQLRELRDVLERAKVGSLARRLDAGALLLECLLGEDIEVEPVAPDVAFDLVGMLVRSVEQRITCEAVEPARPTELKLEDPPLSTLVAKKSTLDDLPVNNDAILGEILENLGVVEKDQVTRAVELQSKESLRIGEALVRTGAATPKQVQRALKIQYHLRYGTMRRVSKPAPEPPAPATPDESVDLGPTKDPDLALASETLIGEVFVQLGLVTPEKIESALAVQRATGLRLGEALVEMGAVTWDQVRQAVETQKRLLHVSGQSLPS